MHPPAWLRNFPGTWRRDLFHSLPPDLLVIITWTFLSICTIYIPVLNQSILRPAVLIPEIIFCPGYVFIVTLFPGKEEITSLERVALSLGTSAAIISFIGLGLSFTPWGIRLEPIVIAISGFILLFTILAHLRRSNVVIWQQYSPSPMQVPAALRREISLADFTITEKMLCIILLAAVIMTIAGVLGLIGSPAEKERFTEFYILGENRTAVNFPMNITRGQDYLMFIGIGNHEHKAMTYTVETWFRTIDTGETSNLTTHAAPYIFDRRTVELQHNETVILPLNVSFNQVWYNRMEFLLFNTGIPGDSLVGTERINRSYRDLHLWIAVQD